MFLVFGGYEEQGEKSLIHHRKERILRPDGAIKFRQRKYKNAFYSIESYCNLIFVYKLIIQIINI